MLIDNYSSILAPVGGGFFAGILIGWALKKFAIIAGLFLAGLAILQHQQIASVNWDKVEGAISVIANTTTDTLTNYNIESLATTNLGIPLTGGMSAGFTIGFMRG